MKFPGVYAAYALIMALFGQTPVGVHLGFLIVNLATIGLIFLIGRRLIDEMTGLAAASAYAILSVSPSVFGFAAHATHFVMLPVLAAALILLRPAEQRSLPMLWGSGVFLGLGLLMKQPGLAFVLFGGAYLFWTDFRARLSWKSILTRSVVYLCGAGVPIAVTFWLLWQAGVFQKILVLDHRLCAGLRKPYVSRLRPPIFRPQFSQSSRLWLAPLGPGGNRGDCLCLACENTGAQHLLAWLPRMLDARTLRRILFQGALLCPRPAGTFPSRWSGGHELDRSHTFALEHRALPPLLIFATALGLPLFGEQDSSISFLLTRRIEKSIGLTLFQNRSRLRISSGNAPTRRIPSPSSVQSRKSIFIHTVTPPRAISIPMH